MLYWFDVEIMFYLGIVGCSVVCLCVSYDLCFI